MINNISLHNVLNYAMSDLEKYKFVATICRIEKARAKLDERSNLLYSDRNKIHHRSRTFFSDKFNRALECLEDNYKHLITKEFLEKENNYWYEEFYSKTTYYKYRKKAVDEFFSLLFRQRSYDYLARKQESFFSCFSFSKHNKKGT